MSSREVVIDAAEEVVAFAFDDCAATWLARKSSANIMSVFDDPVRSTEAKRQDK